MNPVIRNFRSVYTPGGPAARLIWLDDNPPTCVMIYSEIHPDQASAHHTHPWEHELYIIEGAGTLFCDGREYPVREGDAILIPGNVDHYTLNNGGRDAIRRIAMNPLSAAHSGNPSAVSDSGPSSKGGQPLIRNYRDLNQATVNQLIGSRDGAATYIMLYGDLAPGQSSPQHTHPWEHEAYILEGSYTLFCDGKEYPVSGGDAVLVPPNTEHQWRNTSQFPGRRVNVNPIAAEGRGG